MNRGLKTAGLLAVTAVTITGNPAQLSLTPAAANAAQLICASTNYEYSYCRAGVGGSRVQIVEELSRAPCRKGRSWGSDSRGIWVSDGCAARFDYQAPASTGDVVGAAIVGGLIGALLGSSGSDHHAHDSHYRDHSDDYRRPYPVEIEYHVIVEHRRDTSQDADPTVQKFDKDGNPNYDIHGNYQGAHGMGALIDNPDVPETNPDGSGGPN